MAGVPLNSTNDDQRKYTHIDIVFYSKKYLIPLKILSSWMFFLFTLFMWLLSNFDKKECVRKTEFEGFFSKISFFEIRPSRWPPFQKIRIQIEPRVFFGNITFLVNLWRTKKWIIARTTGWRHALWQTTESNDGLYLYLEGAPKARSFVINKGFLLDIRRDSTWVCLIVW